MNKVKITLMGFNYTISTNEDEEYVQEMVKEINDQAQQLLDEGHVSAYDAMVLCLLEYADRYRKAEKSADNLRDQLVEYLEAASSARIEVDERMREIEKLNREIAILRRMTQKGDAENIDDTNSETEK